MTATQADRDRRMQIANTILAQLGGRMFRMMTGAKDFVALDNGLRFKIGARNQLRATHLTIKLLPSDTYDLVFERCQSGREPRGMAQISGVYCDQLQAVFTEYTGLDTRLF